MIDGWADEHAQAASAAAEAQQDAGSAEATGPEPHTSGDQAQG